MLRISQIAQIIIALLIIFFVLIQSKGTGLSSTFGGSFSFYRARRGVEKVITYLTLLLGIALVANSLFLIFLS
jgi:protein translocase SecG subunit